MKRILFLTALVLSLYSCITTYRQTESGFYNVYEQYIPEGCIDYGGYAVHYYGNGIVLVGQPAFGGGWIWVEHYVDFSPVHRYIRQHRINVLEIGFIWLDGRLLFNIMGANRHYTYNPYWGWRYYGYNPYSYHCRPWSYSYHGLAWHKPPRHINYARRDAHRNARSTAYQNSGRSDVKRSRTSVSNRQNAVTTERVKSSTPATQNRRSDVQNSRKNSGSSSVRSSSTREKSSTPAQNSRSSSGRSSDNSRRR